jgi:hypothetical protein
MDFHWPSQTRERQPNSYLTRTLKVLSRLMHGHTVWSVWSKVQVLQLSDQRDATGPWRSGKS